MVKGVRNDKGNAPNSDRMFRMLLMTNHCSHESRRNA